MSAFHEKAYICLRVFENYVETGTVAELVPIQKVLYEFPFSCKVAGAGHCVESPHKVASCVHVMVWKTFITSSDGSYGKFLEPNVNLSCPRSCKGLSHHKCNARDNTVAISMLLFVAISSNVIEVLNAQTICNISGAGLMACKPAATPPTPPPPSSACCSALSHADLRCLCSYKNSKLLPSLGVDPNLAMQLPAKCKLPHPAKC
ncbi:Hypothetical predicted protein [Olea europaea subsp. europaea]|uniref:Bifunctional inhibitor/plant lipid transfer protein/seed storage helical domain-containing protein n=1 Tax=Olea europaea subsp. europaea TaxID=158383 RepID=A0A8S0QC24_OLEEU|nr:Hypothetical predicted protein [Olea europaea subsp. europaea]